MKKFPPVTPVCICGREVPLRFLKRMQKKGKEFVTCSTRNDGCGSTISVEALLAPIDTDDQKCHCCLQRIRKLNPHRMDKQKFKVLAAMVRLHQAGNKWIKVEHGRGLIGSSVVVRDDGGNKLGHIERHVGRLKWFGLVISKGNRTGEYRVSSYGYSFLKGEDSVPNIIYCRDGEVIAESDEHVMVSEIKGVVLGKSYWDHYAEVQVYADELPDTVSAV